MEPLQSHMPPFCIQFTERRDCVFLCFTAKCELSKHYCCTDEGNHQYVNYKESTAAGAIIFPLIFLLLTAFIISRGVAEGIEKMSKVLMPLLFVLLIGLMIRACTLPGADEGLPGIHQPVLRMRSRRPYQEQCRLRIQRG